MTKTDDAVEWLIHALKDALEHGGASESDVEDWLLAAISLEEISLEDELAAREARTLGAWMNASATVH
jgi:plasmid stability protein